MTKYILREEHYKGISLLQRYYGKKLTTSNEDYLIRTAKDCLSILEEIKKGQFYTPQQRVQLNGMREEYLLSKKPVKKNFGNINISSKGIGSIIKYGYNNN
jgi:hypothetical protein